MPLPLVEWDPRRQRDAFLMRVFGKWSQVLWEYEEALEAGNRPFGYLERANVAHLAIAAKQICDSYPWVEVWPPKGKGFVDLCIERPEARVTYWFEAKEMYEGAAPDGNTGDLKRHIVGHLRQARDDLGKRVISASESQIGLLFVVLRPPDQHKDRFSRSTYRQLVRDLVLDRHGPPHFARAHFCRAPASNGDCPPGVLLFGAYYTR